MATVITVVTTHNLAIGVLVGILLTAMFFANKVGRYMAVTCEFTGEGSRTYTVSGQVFFASSEKFYGSFDFKEVLDKVVIDL